MTYESQKKLEVGGDEASNLEALRTELPKALGGSIVASSSAIKSTKKFFLPTLPTRYDWESKDRLGGLKHVILNRMANVNSQIRANIARRLRGHPIAITLATTCLIMSSEFCVKLVHFIDNTLLDLDLAGIDDDSTWQLVTHLVNNMFADQLDNVRSFARDSIEIDNHET